MFLLWCNVGWIPTVFAKMLIQGIGFMITN